MAEIGEEKVVEGGKGAEVCGEERQRKEAAVAAAAAAAAVRGRGKQTVFAPGRGLLRLCVWFRPQRKQILLVLPSGCGPERRFDV